MVSSRGMSFENIFIHTDIPWYTDIRISLYIFGRLYCCSDFSSQIRDARCWQLFETGLRAWKYYEHPWNTWALTATWWISCFATDAQVLYMTRPYQTRIPPYSPYLRHADRDVMKKRFFGLCWGSGKWAGIIKPLYSRCLISWNSHWCLNIWVH